MIPGLTPAVLVVWAAGVVSVVVLILALRRVTAADRAYAKTTKELHS